MMNSIIEISFIEKLNAKFSRSPLQKNKLQETDAEIISLGAGSGKLLAITTDSIIEEIATGLYNDPYLIGWMSVMVNLSDLAAVGADALGLLISETFPPVYPQEQLSKLQDGISDACKASNCYIFGGDTNFGNQMMITGTAIGLLNNGKYLSRVGCKPGDLLYASNRLGRGNIFALAHFFKQSNLKMGYKPLARLKEGSALPGIASSAMDSSDGVISTLDQLMRLNNIGFKFDEDWINTIDEESFEISETVNIPPWLLLAGQHGEFELIFTVPKVKEKILLESAEKIGWKPLKIGKAIKEQKLLLPLYGSLKEIDTAYIRNLSSETGGNIEKYIVALIGYDASLK